MPQEMSAGAGAWAWENVSTGPLGFHEEPFYQDDDQSIQTAPKVSFAPPAA